MIKRNVCIYILLTALLLTSFLGSANQVLSSTVEDIKNQIDQAGNKQDSIQNQLDKINHTLAEQQKEYDAISKAYVEIANQYQQETSALEKQLDELEIIFHEITVRNLYLEGNLLRFSPVYRWHFACAEYSLKNFICSL